MKTCEICKRNSNELQVNYCSKASMYLCSKHKNQIHRHGRITDGDNKEVFCEICGKPSKEARVYWCSACSKTLCLKHRGQFLKNGSFFERTRRDPNEFEVCEETTKIFFSNSPDGKNIYSLIDTEDLEKCLKHRWLVTEVMGSTRYAKGTVNGRKNSLHRIILDYDGKKQVDHINRNGLDNRKENLRIVTASENCVNTRSYSKTGEKNIYHKREKFQVQIKRHYKSIYNETFPTLEEAVIARDAFIEQYNKKHNR